MKAARLYVYDAAMAVDLKIENVAEPTIGRPDQVVVKVGAAGLCRTDLHIIEGVWKAIMDAQARCCPTSWATRTPAGSRMSARA
jgi:NAD+-dependent secondary alcohol dehydrogenase Adh1